MAQKVHSFDESLIEGARGEERVKSFLQSQGYTVSRNDIEDKFRPDFHIDSHVSGRPEKVLVGKTLEVKSDARTIETGNVAIELVSNIGTGRPGWAYSTTSDFLAYLSAGDGLLSIASLSDIRRRLEKAWHSSKLFSAYNRFFTAVVLCVPMEELKPISLYYGRIP